MPVINQRNILFCLFDSLSAADSSLLAAAGELPILSRLCESSAHFTRAYSPSPESSPARASVFTGLDPCVHGLWTNGVRLPDNERTFVKQLSPAGYSRYLAGRYQLAGVSHWTTEQIQQGEFDQMDWAHGPLHRSRQNAYHVWLQKHASEHYAKIFTTQADPHNTSITKQQQEVLAALPDKLSFNHWVGEQVGEWIHAQPINTPFLAVAGFSVGDTLGAEPHPESDGEGLIVQSLRQADAAIGRLLEQLAAGNRAQDTVVIVTSARGNVDATSRDQALTERSIRVPLLIHSAEYARQRLDSAVSTMDIAPTVLALANAPVGPRMQGQSLLGVVDGSTTPRAWALSRLRRGLPSQTAHWQTAFCTDTMKLIVRHDKQLSMQDAMSLYNLETDPNEEHDLAGLEAHAICLEQMIDKMIDARCALEDRTEPRIAEF